MGCDYNSMIVSSLMGILLYHLCKKEHKIKVESSVIKEDYLDDIKLVEKSADQDSIIKYQYSNILYNCDTFYDIICEYIYRNYKDKINNFHYDENVNIKEYRWKGLVKMLQDNPNTYEKIVPYDCDFTVQYNGATINIKIENIKIENIKDNFKLDRILSFTQCGSASEKLLKRLVISSDNKEDILEFITMAKKEIVNMYETNMKSGEDTIRIWLYKKDWWSLLSHTPKRNLESIYLKKGQREGLFDKLSNFYEDTTREEYLRYGVPYKYVVMLWGIPGSGKTSTIKSLASELDCDIYILPLTKSMNDYEFIDAFNSINDDEKKNGKKKLIVIEDIDTIFTERKSNDDSITVGLQNILNCIDGLSFSEGTVLFLTANQPQKMDYALLRSGRINLKVELGYADEYQTKNMYSTYFNEGFEIFYSKIQHLEYTTADLQELFFNHRHLDSCVDKIKELHEIIKLNKPENYEENKTEEGYLYN